MVDEILRAAFFVGLLTVWLGFVLMIVPVQLRFVFRRAWWTRLTMPLGERLRVMNEEIRSIGKTRIGRLGQGLTAAGISVLILTGIGWIVLRIVERQGG